MKAEQFIKRKWNNVLYVFLALCSTDGMNFLKVSRIIDSMVGILIIYDILIRRWVNPHLLLRGKWLHGVTSQDWWLLYLFSLVFSLSDLCEQIWGIVKWSLALLLFSFSLSIIESSKIPSSVLMSTVKSMKRNIIIRPYE